MNFKINITLIEKLKEAPLPGEVAQYKLAPDTRMTKAEYLLENPSHRHSSILILLYPDKKGVISTVLIQRQHSKNAHGGQIAFPGGKNEPSDTSNWHTAIREADEEIGVDSGQIEFVKELTSLFIPVSKFMVYPFIGITETTPQFIRNEAEVRQLIPTPLTHVIEMPVARKQIHTSYGSLEAPYYTLGEHQIWGATAMIISEMNDLIKNLHFKI